MEQQTQIYLWKRLYWQAIQDGYEPGQAEDFASRVLAGQLNPPPPAGAPAPPADDQSGA